MRNVIAGIAFVPLVFAACSEHPTGPTATPQFAATVLTINERFLTDLTVFVPCAAGGAGETVALTGYLHALIHITDNAAGGFVVKTHFQPQGITGTGAVTGAKYQATGVTQDVGTVNAGENYTLVNNFRIIGQGPGNNFLVHQTFHFTIDANGVLTALVDNITVDCK